MKASLKNYRQAPRKTRLVGALLVGKSVSAAQEQLRFMPKRAAEPVMKLLQSAIKNAEVAGAEQSDLFVKSVRVDQGLTLKRSMPRARGSAFRINKRSSHVYIELGTKKVESSKLKAESKDAKPKAKKVKPKAVAKKKVTKAKA